MIALTLLACTTLDAFVFNGIHCSDVGPSTCDDVDEPWDKVCLSCPEAIDLTRTYDWMPANVGSLREVDPVALSRMRLPTDDGAGELDILAIEGFGPLGEITVVYDHGNFASMEHYAPRIRMLHNLGFTVFAWDYRGYGKSDPDTYPTADQFLADARLVRRAAADFAPNPERVLVYGFSLGAVPAVEQVLDQPSCGLILENPFTSIAAITASNTTLTLGEQFLSEGAFDNLTKLEGYRGPMLAMTGTLDTTFPPEEVVALVDASSGPTELWRVKGATHGVGPTGVAELDFDAYSRRIITFATERCLTGL